ncbi:unnamed protein product [Calypogeia fissa]
MAKGSGGSPKDESPPDEAAVIIPALHGELGLLSSRERVSFWGIRSKRAPKPWRGRLRSRSTSYLKLFEGLPHGPTVFSNLTLYDRHGSDPQLGYHKGSQEAPSMAWIDLNGRLVNSETATSLTRVGAQLGEQESFVWDGLCPLQRVLVVAVAAAAAAQAKENNAKELRRLRRVMYRRESDLMLMREELGSLLSQVDSQTSEIDGTKGDPCITDSLDELVELLSQVDIQDRRLSELSQIDVPDRRLSDFEDPDHNVGYVNEGNGLLSINSDVHLSEQTPEQLITPAVNRHLTFSDLTKKISPIQEESPGSNHPGQDLMEKMLMSSSWIESLDLGLLLEEQAGEQEYQSTESINKDVVFEQSIDERELEKEITEPLKVDLYSSNGTWENINQTPADIIQENHSVIEWLSETSSVIMDPFSPMPSEKKHGNRNQGTEDCSKDYLPKTATEEKSFADRARCANIVLSLKKQVITLLDEAASNVLDALTIIAEKARQLEGAETNALGPEEQEDALEKKPEVSTAIKANVSKASDKITKLQTAMVQLWDSLGPEAIASLDISPPDFDDYLANLQIAKILNDDACDLSTGSVNLQTWTDWFRRGLDNPESSFLRRIQLSEETESETQNETPIREKSESLSHWPPSAGRSLKFQKLSPGVEAVRQKVEKIMLPLFDTTEPAPLEKTSNLVTIREELVAEFEKTATKVANLKNYVRACDAKRKQVEKKLLEAWEQDSKNQVKSGNEITELKRQVRLKEAAYQQLIASRKALVSSKTKEIAELREDCRRHNMALQDMASAAKATQESSEKRLAMLEEICRKKDSAIISLKQEIFELEAKVQELQSCQTPSQLRPMNLPPTGREVEDVDSTDDVFDDENAYRAFGEECQLRGSYQSLCGSENRRTSWGSDLSAQEFHIIDTPWSSELTAGQDFNIIEEAAFHGRSLGVFQNVTSSQEFLRGSLRKLGSTPGGGLDPNNGPSSSGSSGDIENRPTINIHREARKANNGGIPNHRKELSKSVANMNAVTARSKNRDERLRASTGVLSAVGPNTPFKPQRSSAVSKQRPSSSSLHKAKENGGRSRQKWV